MFTVCLTPEDFKKTMGVTVGMKIKKKKGEEVPKTEDEEQGGTKKVTPEIED